MQISDFSVNRYKSSIMFCKLFLRKKSLGSVLFSRDSQVTANIHTSFFGLWNNYFCREALSKNSCLIDFKQTQLFIHFNNFKTKRNLIVSGILLKKRTESFLIYETVWSCKWEVSKSIKDYFEYGQAERHQHTTVKYRNFT